MDSAGSLMRNMPPANCGAAAVAPLSAWNSVHPASTVSVTGISVTAHSAADPTWSHDGGVLYFQDFLEDGMPIYRITVPQGKPEPVATIENLRPITATEYRLIGLAPGDLPMVSVRTSSVNLYEANPDKR